ncbi:hypothetical protein [Hathewaya massiliensis]|uniref:hypothetical protein n=1 Tax=Hathewaya massiliensis TaxID=1964382 RepID=UPI00115B9300|nr:hypothetical protein [Hathewaya massiliensis]
MAFPDVLRANLTEQQSIDAIIESEAGLIQCMARLFCGERNPTTGVVGPGLVPFLKSINRNVPGNIEKRAELVKQILCSYGCKECAIAEVVEALADKIVVDKDIVGSERDCSCCKCK